ncbi:MAG: hypothetical protein AAFW75_27205 [Cyanobacteria bacterium J06636_16]
MVRRYITGQSNTGKTSLLREMIVSDPSSTILVIDTSGALTKSVPHDLLFDPTITRWNPFDEPVDRNLAPNLFSDTIVDLHGRSSSDLPLWLINLSLNCKFLASAFIDGKRKMTQIPTFLLDASFRTNDLFNIMDMNTRQYWDHFNAMSDRDRTNQVASTFSTFSAPLLDARVRALFDTSDTKISLAEIEGKTTMVHLPITQYGSDTVKFIGSLVLAYANHLSQPCSIYVDDCDLFAKDTLIEILTRGRGSLSVAHQYIDQVHPTLFAALLGNCEERYSFRMSSLDAAVLDPGRHRDTSGKWLYQLPSFEYRQLPYEHGKSPVGVTVPLEK